MWKGRNLSLAQDRRVLEVRSAEPARLDVYLSKALCWKSRSRIQNVIRSGHVTVNSQPGKPSRKVRRGDTIIVHLSLGTGLTEDYSELPLEILYEDAWLVAVSKPPNLLVHPVGRHVYDTLINHLHHRYRGKSAAIPARRKHAGKIIPRLCHRLDRDTTGVILVAKESLVHREVSLQFERRQVQKRYCALVCGTFPEDRHALTYAIGEGRCLQTSLEHAVLKPARTEIQVRARLGDYTLLDCLPRTGRQNQIRIHLGAAGYPIVGDERFGGSPPPVDFPERFLLHSRGLEFYHPRLKSRVQLTASLPEDFRYVVETLTRAL